LLVAKEICLLKSCCHQGSPEESELCIFEIEEIEMQEEIYLTVAGKPGEQVQVWYRGDATSDLADPSPIVFTGKLGLDGQITVRVPRAYLCLGFPEKSGCKPLDLSKEKGDAFTVQCGTEEEVSDTATAYASSADSEVEEQIRESSDHDADAQQESEADTTFNAAALNVARAVATRPWRVARSLLTLREQINRRAPERNKASDGTIGDSRHCSGNPRASDHCPWIIDGANGVVSAMDITHDAAHGCDANAIAEAIRTARDARVKYIIWNRRIANSSSIGGHEPWAWRPYTGANGHTQHIHISVKSDHVHYDSIVPWAI
jgi:hypothetical protein